MREPKRERESQANLDEASTSSADTSSALSDLTSSESGGDEIPIDITLTDDTETDAFLHCLIIIILPSNYVVLSVLYCAVHCSDVLSNNRVYQSNLDNICIMELMYILLPFYRQWLPSVQLFLLVPSKSKALNLKK